MKPCFFALFILSLATPNFALAEDSQPKTEKLPESAIETVKVTEQGSLSLFERVREAHLRAIQHGIVAPSKT